MLDCSYNIIIINAYVIVIKFHSNSNNESELPELLTELLLSL